MTYTWATWLADALRAGGCQVAEDCGDWRHAGRPSSTGGFDPRGVLWHHTGTTASAANPFPTRSTLINGRADLPGPLCHVGIDYAGVCHLIAAGRANHAGDAKASGPMPAGDGNALYVGLEIDYNGTQAMSAPQYAAAIAAAAAILDHLGRDASYARGHRETSTTGKWDPGGYDLDTMRADVATGGTMPLSESDAILVADTVWNRYAVHTTAGGTVPYGQALTTMYQGAEHELTSSPGSTAPDGAHTHKGASSAADARLAMGVGALGLLVALAAFVLALVRG